MAELEEKGQELQAEAQNAKVQAKAVETADDNFDWDSFEADEVVVDDKKKQDLEKMYDETLSTIPEKKGIVGTVIQMTSRKVVINIGLNFNVIVSVNEFRTNPDLKVGDQEEVNVESKKA